MKLVLTSERNFVAEWIYHRERKERRKRRGDEDGGGEVKEEGKQDWNEG